MRQLRGLAIAFFSAFLLVVTAGYGQSLGDVAREQREKQKAKQAQDSKAAPPAHKVITDEDMPEHPEAADDDTANSDSSPAESSAAPSAPGRSGEEWKSAILAQKNAVAALQAQCDKLNDSIHYVQANLYVNGAEYNQYQQRKQQQLQQMQKQLAGQKKKLEGMQEAARKAGFGSAVYEP